MQLGTKAYLGTRAYPGAYTLPSLPDLVDTTTSQLRPEDPVRLPPLSHLPVWTVDDLTVTAMPTFDGLGREWSVVKGQDTGWINPPATRTQRESRPEGIGAFRSVAWRDSRQFVLGGYVVCPTAAIRERTELELSSLCGDPGRLYEFRRRTSAYDQTAMVELDDAPKVEMVTIYRLDWQFTFAAPDPRKHDAAWQDPMCRPPAASTSSLRFAAPGLDFSGQGLDFGDAPGLSQIAQVGNHGSAPAYPMFTLTGPLSNPSILHIESGRVVTYAAEVLPNETVVINCDEFDQRGARPHACVSSARGNTRSLLTIGTDWPAVDPKTTATFALRSYGTPDASLTVSLRSAWW